MEEDEDNVEGQRGDILLGGIGKGRHRMTNSHNSHLGQIFIVIFIDGEGGYFFEVVLEQEIRVACIVDRY